MFCSMSQTLSFNSPSKTIHEKCQDITTEIYKRINITFAIKDDKINSECDLSDLIDSNELSNGTDLFACDKSDSLSSSHSIDFSSKERTRKIINLNNNEEALKKPSRRVKKYRKRVKKHKLKNIYVDCSSDEEPLSRIVDGSKKRTLLKLLKTDNDIDQNPKEQKYNQEKAVETLNKLEKCTGLECDSCYNTRSTLRIHTMTHCGDRQHICHTCFKSFTCFNTWKRHQRVRETALSNLNP